MSREEGPRPAGMRPPAIAACGRHPGDEFRDHRAEAASARPGFDTGEWVAVCRLSEIVPNTGVCALVGRRQVAVFRLDDDSVYAVDNHDPFSRANVLSRGIVGDQKGELVVASPVYKQHFSLVTGQCLEDPAVRLPVFPACLKGDLVWVRGEPSPQAE